jgi:hypothetical protein
MAQVQTIKLQTRITPELQARLTLACKLWAPKDAVYTLTDVVRLVLEERLPKLPIARAARP